MNGPSTISETSYDYIIVGAGSAGCVLAYRLSQDPSIKVLLLEAGPTDAHPFVHIPKGMAKLFTNPRRMWFFQTEGSEETPSETWLRGRGLGGSSSVNGMVYLRGQPADYDDWAAAGASGWGSQEMWRCFREMEDHEMGDDGCRGSGGPLTITRQGPSPLGEILIRAAERMGLRRKEDLNQPEQEGVGYTTATISKGRRMSAARAFLRPARRRPNLTILTDALVDRVMFEGTAAIGVEARINGQRRTFRGKETILSAGALQSAKLLQLSGIGPGELLRSHGIGVVADRPAVGQHMLEHRLMVMTYRLKRPLGLNRSLRGWRLGLSALRYALTRQGPLASSGYEVGAFVRTRPDLDRPDAELLVGPYSMALKNGKPVIGEGDGLHMFGYPLRSRSEGSIAITSADPDAPARIRPNYLSDPSDREVTIGMFRMLRRWALEFADIVDREVYPGPELECDADIIKAYRSRGQSGYHACGTCRMGSDADAVLDPQLRVRGVTNLRVADGSIMPTMVSANTNGPIMAIGWRAAEIILADRFRP